MHAAFHWYFIWLCKLRSVVIAGVRGVGWEARRVVESLGRVGPEGGSERLGGGCGGGGGRGGGGGGT
jgi:hypothetical protein